MASDVETVAHGRRAGGPRGRAVRARRPRGARGRRGGGSLVVLRDLGRDEALRDARQFATLTGQGIVEPALRDGAPRRRPGGARGGSTASCSERVLGERIVRVKVWAHDGRIVYSDEPR